jgi:hypothetical protein
MVTGSPNRVTGAPSARNSIEGSPFTRHVAALAAYAVIMCVALLPKLLPARPGRILSNSPADGSIFLWSLGWWPHAIAHGELLPYTHVLYAPTGTNLAWTTSLGLPGVLAAPITSAFGVIAAFNVLAVLAPITGAWATYLLVHRVTSKWPASFAAGLLFAFSPLEMTEVAIGHLNLSLAALVPVGAHVVLRRLDGSMSPRAFVFLFALVVAAQMAISTEVLLTASIFGGVALALLYLWDRELRPALRRLGALAGLGYLAAAIVSSPMLYAAFALPHPAGLAAPNGTLTPMSGVRTVVPGASTLRAGLLHPSRQDSAAAALLVVVPLALILADLIRRRWTTPAVRALALTGVAALGCSVGVLVVGGRAMPTPWAAAVHVPLLRLVRPQRLTMYVWLIAAVGVGVWLADRPVSWRRWGAAAIVLAAMLPRLWWGGWTSVIPATPIVAHSPIAPGENVLVVTAPGPATLRFDDLAFPTVWQAESNFSFRLANGYVGSFPPVLPGAVQRLVFGAPLLSGDEAALWAWFRRAGVSWILVVRPSAATAATLEGVVGSAPLLRGGVALYRVEPPAGQA